MKNKKIIILIVILLVIAIGLISYYFIVKDDANYNNNGDGKVDNVSYYRCEPNTNIIENDKFGLSYVLIINYDNGYVKDTKAITRIKYHNKKDYDERDVSMFSQDGDVDYNSDDSNLVLEIIPKKFRKLEDGNNNEIFVTINNYIDALRNDGYTCVNK